MKTNRTRSQEKILKLLKTLKRSISAQDLYMELRKRSEMMGLATVYRSLDALKLEGLVQVRTLSNGESLYSLTKEDYHHLTCLQCGASIAIQECPVHDLESRLSDSYQFKIFYHTLEFFGLCTQCQSNQTVEAGVTQP
ncbi:MAG: transcriptional repressor [Cyanobacteria bacterium]|nr:transcriptional repressor [Cyanobacteriota bacterium]MDW8200551.1 transcriptional repressor [Cyanobacteriota bacterium SKYGB_h_bin112]